MARVLIVDDEPEILSMLREYLEVLGHEVLLAGTGREALDLLERVERLDGALVDWSLPGISGPDVVQQLHEAMPGCRLYAITGHEPSTILHSAAGALLSGVFQKPFSLRRVSEELARALDGR